MINNLGNIFDKGVGVQDNLDIQEVSFTSNGSANTEDAVTHSLGRVPVGYVVASQDKAGSVYVSGTTWTKTTVYVKTSGMSVALKLILY